MADSSDNQTPPARPTIVIRKPVRLTEAAHQLGISVADVRLRIKNGELRSLPTRVLMDVQVDPEEEPQPHGLAHLGRTSTIYKLSDTRYTPTQTYRQAGLKGPGIAVLVALSFFLDENTGLAHPKVESIAKAIGLAEKNVRIWLKKLVQFGLLVVRQKANRHPDNRESDVYGFGPAILMGNGATDQLYVRTYVPVGRSERPVTPVDPTRRASFNPLDAAPPDPGGPDAA